MLILTSQILRAYLLVKIVCVPYVTSVNSEVPIMQNLGWEQTAGHHMISFLASCT
jgi:hypothetical protein